MIVPTEKNPWVWLGATLLIITMGVMGFYALQVSAPLPQPSAHEPILEPNATTSATTSTTSGEGVDKAPLQ